MEQGFLRGGGRCHVMCMSGSVVIHDVMVMLCCDADGVSIQAWYVCTCTTYVLPGTVLYGYHTCITVPYHVFVWTT